MPKEIMPSSYFIPESTENASLGRSRRKSGTKECLFSALFAGNDYLHREEKF